MYAGGRLVRRVLLVLFGLISIVIVFRTFNRFKFYPAWSSEWLIWTDYYYDDPYDPLNTYIKIHESILVGRRQPRVVFNGEIRPGYANKMYGVLTSMVAAVLTDSALIIRWKKVEDYIEPPLLRSFEEFDNNSFLSLNFRLVILVSYFMLIFIDNDFLLGGDKIIDYSSR